MRIGVCLISKYRSFSVRFGSVPVDVCKGIA